MYETVLFIHSYWAYLVVLILIIASINSMVGYFTNKEYGATNFRIALFTLIVSHIQLLIGVVLLVTAIVSKRFGNIDMGTVMGDKTLRLLFVEHPLTMVIAVALITVGYSKHKRKLTSKPKFKLLGIFYTIALILILSLIPWNNWF